MANKRSSKERINPTKSGKWANTQINALSPEEKVYWECEPATRGFCIRVSPSGKKTYFFRYNNLGKRKYINLGATDKVKLVDARSDASLYASQLSKGLDPRQQIEQNKAAAAKAEQQQEADKKLPTVDEVLDSYLSGRSSNTQDDAGRLFRNSFCDVRQKIGSTKIKDVTEDMLNDFVQCHIKRGKMRNAGKLYAYLQAAFKNAKKTPSFNLRSWHNPFDSMIKPNDTDSKPVNRALDPNEIRLFWKLLNDNPTNMLPGTIAILKILMLTGQRVEQTSRMKWKHLDLDQDIWDVPPEETKTGKRTSVGHIVPLSQYSIEIIQSQPRFEDEELVFPGRHGGKPFSASGISHPIQKLLQHSEVDPFTARDLRRTFTTHLSRIGVLSEIRNRIQDHAVAGDLESKHYNRYDYLKEKRAALEKWERELKRIIGEPESDNNVIELKVS